MRETFPIEINGKIIPALWGTYAMKLFCDRRKLSLIELIDFLGNGSFSVTDIIDLLMCASEYAYAREGKQIDFTEIDMAEWIDDCGGLGAGEDSKATEFVTHIIKQTITNTSDKKAEETDKKKD